MSNAAAAAAAAQTLLVRGGAGARAGQWGRLCLVSMARRRAALVKATGGGTAAMVRARARGFAGGSVVGRLEADKRKSGEEGEAEGAASASESDSMADVGEGLSESDGAGLETLASSVDGDGDGAAVDELVARKDGESAHAEERRSNTANPETWTSIAGAGATESPHATISSTDAKQSTSAGQPPVKFAFAFDIDGVLLHKSTPIPGAIETLKFLEDRNIPFILLTNGGGKSEEDRITQLHESLGVRLSLANFVQSHTPFRGLTSPKLQKDPVQRVSGVPMYLARQVGLKNGLAESTILVTGSHAERARDIALSYGFKSVVTPADILKAKPDIFAFEHTPFYDAQHPRALPKPIYDPNDAAAVKLEDCLKIDAILVFNDPRDWAVDIQLITDLLLSHRGYLGTYSPKNGVNGHWQTDGQPALVYSNSDLLWSTGYPLPRFGQGAFQAAVKGAWDQIVSEATAAPTHITAELKTFQYGKPHKVTYFYAQDKLAAHFSGQQQQGSRAAAKPAQSQSRPALGTVYMVGDNPESDIRGAVQWVEQTKKSGFPWARTHPSARGSKLPSWQACLVRTGVWSEAKTPVAALGARKAVPDTVQDDVKAVVNWALEREGWSERVE